MIDGGLHALYAPVGAKHRRMRREVDNKIREPADRLVNAAGVLAGEPGVYAGP